MVATSDLFSELLYQLTPSSAELDRVRSHRDEVQRRLKLEGVVEFINTGSYIKNTAIRPFDDIDLFVALEPTEYEKAKDRILTRLAWQLRLSYPASWVRTQAHSVGIVFASGVRVDVVPAFVSREDECYYIRNRHDKEWVATNPHLQKAFFNERQSQDRRYRDIIKLVKHWKNHRRVRWSSYLMELIVALWFDEEGIPDGRDVALHAFFAWVCEQDWSREVYYFEDHLEDHEVPDESNAPMTILDPTSGENNVAENVTRKELKEFLGVCNTARRRGATALAATSRVQAIKAWRDVLPWFPSR